MIQCDLEKSEATLIGDTMTLLSEFALVARTLKSALMEGAVATELEADIVMGKAFTLGMGEEIKRKAGIQRETK